MPRLRKHPSQSNAGILALYLSEAGVTVAPGTAGPVNITLIRVVELPLLPPYVWVRRIQLVEMLVADALVVPVPNRRADEDSTGIMGAKGGAVVREVVLDVPEVSVVDTETMELDEDFVVETETAELDDDLVVDTETGELDDLVVDTETAEIDAESEIGAGVEFSGGKAEPRMELAGVEDALEDADVLCVAETDAVVEVLPLDAVGCDPLSVVLIETSLCVTAAAFAAPALIVLVMVTRVVVVAVLAGPMYPHHL
jgi:hypothetical protein